MAYLVILKRDIGAGLTLGWLLAIAIGGGVLVFSVIGILLSWHIKRRPELTTPSNMRQVSNSTDDHKEQKLTRRLQKRRYMLADSTSRLSLSLPPVLPPLPTYHSFDFFNTTGRKRTKSWVDEDRLHGPKVSKHARESWFRRDSWLGRVPTLPSLMTLDSAERGESDGGSEQMIHVQKRASATTGAPLMLSRTAPALPMPIPSPERQTSPTRGRIRVPAQAHVRPSATDSDLKFILQSTEQRLREGQSQSPTKTPRATSPLKASSPMKTSQSCRTVSSYHSARTTVTTQIQQQQVAVPSPAKRATVHSLPQTHSRNASISSLDSVANSLLAEAAQELELPSGLSSPSRARSREDLQDNDVDGGVPVEEEEKKKPQEPRQRSKSVDSTASSSLSTVYSVDERDDIKSDPKDYDPFFDASKTQSSPWQAKHGAAFGTHRRTKTMSALGPMTMSMSEERLVPSPLRPMSLNAQPSNRGLGNRTNTMGLTIVLQPPLHQFQHQQSTKDVEHIPLAYPVSPSLTSFVTESVSTTDDEDISFGDDSDDKMSETPKPEWITTQHEKSSPPTPADAMSNPATAPSSPYDEQDILSMLLSNSAPRRALPIPPLHVSHVDENVLPTPLSPRPRRDFSQQLRQISHSSSVYDDESSFHDPAAVSTGSPAKKRSLREPTNSSVTVGSAIAELRRMNSMVSSYSVASIASTRGGDNDSPTLPALRGGGFSPNRSHSKIGKIGRKNYLNVGGGIGGSSSPAPSKKRSTRGSTRRSNATGLGIEVREVNEDEDAGKENQSRDLKIPRIEITSGLRIDVSRQPSKGGRPKRNPVDDLVAEHRRHAHRDSMDSLGLYDKDGFLMSSPEREARGRCLRM